MLRIERILRHRSYWKSATALWQLCRVTASSSSADLSWCVLRGLTTTSVLARNRDYLDDDGNGVYVDNYFEDEYNKDFKNRKGKKGQKIREKPARSFKRSSRYREDEFGKYNDPDKEMARWEDEEDNDFKRPKEKKNTFKDQQFRDKPASAVNKSNIYKGIKFDEHQIPDSVAARWEPPVDRPAMRNTAKVDTSKLAPFEKNFYQLHPDTKNFSDEEVDKFRQERHVTVHGNKILKPLRKIEEAGFPEFVLRILSQMKITTPTPIQSQCWPMVLSGLNMIGIAQTGSGKTLAYALPALVHILAQPRVRVGEGPIVLIVAPTRELTQQIMKVVQLFNLRGIRSVSVYGGVSKWPQQQRFMNGVEICVATPGRLNDLLSTGATNLDRCTFLVLDEADRMLDMGFEPQIREIVSRIRDDRQTVMWSATWPIEVHRLAKEFLSDYCQVNIGSTDLVANHNITQIVEVCLSETKSSMLKEALVKASEDPNHKILIFLNTKRQVEWLYHILMKNRIPCSAIHGDKNQHQRDTAMHNFRSGRNRILLATDVAARGLDVEDVTHVINYDFPLGGVEDYIHRIGRTARANKKGTAITFFTPGDAKFVAKLVAVMKEAGQEVGPQLMSIMQSRGLGGPVYRRHGGDSRYTTQRSNTNYSRRNRYNNVDGWKR
ncbi:uncharacterized protein [Dysidea avara]|uniref:uncharacterized protein isoform X2 n=1 Tax=Dysidea avara TaxID=196820 RepID=UPI003320340B